jgi:deoxyribodipyrimidine photo-lyase
MATHLVWFRADLRVHDNYALAAACNNREACVKALFIATPGQWKNMQWPHGRPRFSPLI